MTENNAPVAIIGFGAAGFNAATALRNSGYEGQIQVFSDLETRPYSPILTSYYAGGLKTYEECFPWTEDEVADLNLDVKYSSPVIGLDPEAHLVKTTEGEFEYSKCLISTGAAPNCVGFPRDCGYKPLVLHSMEDAEALKAVLDDPDVSRVLVSGASMVALKTVEAALAKGKQVSLVGMNPHVLDFNALPAAAERFERGLEQKGVQLFLGQTIQSVEVLENAAAKLRVTFSTGAMEEFDAICVAHGMANNLGFVQEGTIDIDRGVLIDEFMHTSAADVFAAGDIAQGIELISGQPRIIGIWKNAALQGACAGKAMAAELAGQAPNPKDAVKGSISTNTIAVDGTLFLSGGTMELTPFRTVEVREDDEMTVVYIWEDDGDGRRLVGYNITADHDEEGGVTYDTSAMLTMRIMEGLRA